MKKGKAVNAFPLGESPLHGPSGRRCDRVGDNIFGTSVPIGDWVLTTVTPFKARSKE